MLDGEDCTSWSEDLRLEVINEFLTRIVTTAEVAEVDLPHIVICRDPETGSVSYSGPFPDGLSALVFIERECLTEEELDEDDPLTFSVAALHPADPTG